jgi:hypothetical protein
MRFFPILDQQNTTKFYLDTMPYFSDNPTQEYCGKAFK